jgi:NADH:ubiquinone oxidoreductase subunit E
MTPAASSQATTERLTAILARYPGARREHLIPLLQDIQGELDYLPAEAIDAAARHLGVTAAKVYGVATFYNQFRLIKPGRHRIAVCRGTACHVIGSATLLDHLEAELGVKAGGTTRDGEFSLEIVACLGACSMAPVVMVDGTFHGRVTAKSLARLLRDLRRGAGHAAEATP